MPHRKEDGKRDVVWREVRRDGWGRGSRLLCDPRERGVESRGPSEQHEIQEQEGLSGHGAASSARFRHHESSLHATHKQVVCAADRVDIWPRQQHGEEA